MFINKLRLRILKNTNVTSHAIYKINNSELTQLNLIEFKMIFLNIHIMS